MAAPLLEAAYRRAACGEAQARLLEGAHASEPKFVADVLQTFANCDAYWRPQLRTKAQRADAEHFLGLASKLRASFRAAARACGLLDRVWRQ